MQRCLLAACRLLACCLLLAACLLAACLLLAAAVAFAAITTATNFQPPTTNHQPHILHLAPQNFPPSTAAPSPPALISNNVRPRNIPTHIHGLLRRRRASSPRRNRRQHRSVRQLVRPQNLTLYYNLEPFQYNQNPCCCICQFCGMPCS